MVELAGASKAAVVALAVSCTTRSLLEARRDGEASGSSPGEEADEVLGTLETILDLGLLAGSDVITQCLAFGSTAAKGLEIGRASCRERV